MSGERPQAADRPDEQARTDGDSTSSSLLVRVKANDLAAWQDLVSLYGPLVYQWCRRKGLQDADAADVGQEVFRAVAASIDRFRRDRPNDSFRRWLWGIARYKLSDFWRRRAAEPNAQDVHDARWELQQLEDHHADVEPTSSADMSELLERALALMRSGFEPATWQAFWSVAIDGRSTVEVAHELQMTVGAVYVAKSRVLRRLRDELNDLDEFVQ